MECYWGMMKRAKEKRKDPQGVSRLSIRKTPFHVPDRGAHIRQGLSHMLNVPTTHEEVPCAPPSGNHLFHRHGTRQGIFPENGHLSCASTYRCIYGHQTIVHPATRYRGMVL